MKTTPPLWRKFSPTLTAAINPRRSRRGLACYGLLCLALLSAPLLIFLDGYPLGACAALLAALYACIAGWGERPGAVRRLAGQWQMWFPGRGWVRVEILAPVYSPPWLLALRWRAAETAGEEGAVKPAAHWLYLWPDSLDPAQWRRLRRELRLAIPGASAGER